MSWPILYSQVLKVKDPSSPVGVATMWTEREVVGKLLADQSYCAVGNLYSAAGISAMIRNIYAKPTIRHVVLWGADLSASGQSFINFMQHGVDAQHKIINDTQNSQIEHEIGHASLDHFRQNVEVVNLRGKPPAQLRATITKLSRQKPEPFSDPKTFPHTKPAYQTFPSEQIGVRVHGTSVAQTWLKVLLHIMRYGRGKTTRYASDNQIKELLNVVAVVQEENDLGHPYLPEYFPFRHIDLKRYYPQVLSPKDIPGVSYTYGQRLRNHDGVDQIAAIIDLIRRRPFSKKQAAFTADVSHDWAVDNIDRGDTPCLTQVLTSIQDDKLCMTAHFRSQDMVHGWPRNVFSLLKLQQLIADETGYARGPFCMITHSAHIYADDYQRVEQIFDKHYEEELGFTPQQHFEEDPRGNFVVSVEGQVSTGRRGRPRKIKGADGDRVTMRYAPGSGEIVVRLYAPGGGLLLRQWRGRRAMELYMQLTDWEYLRLPAHTMYVGTELQRAEFALRFGLVYNQDPAAHKEL